MTTLREEAARGVKWTSVSTAFVVVVGIVQVAVLTRLLTRADFGLMAMVTTVTGFAAIYADMGLSNAIVQRRAPTREQLSTLYWTNVAAGVVLFVAVSALSPLVAAFFREERLQPLVVMAAAVFVVTTPGQQFQFLLQKELEFDRLARIDMTSATAGFAGALTTAALGLGVRALIVGVLTQAATRTAQLLWVGWRRWRPHLHYARRDLEGYLSFGLYQLGERSIYYWAANVDYLLIGRYLGAAPLGIYTIAYNLVVLPVSRLNPVLTKVAFPVFARRQDDADALRRGFGELIELVALVTFPLLVGLGVTAPLAVPVIFGQAWEPAVVLVQILVVMGLLKCLSNPLGSVLLAKGRADVGFWLNVATTAVTVAVLVVAVRWGTSAVAWGHTLVNLLFFFVELWIIERIVAMRWPGYFARLARPSLASGAMAAAVAGTYALVERAGMHGAVELVLLVCLGALVYMCTWLLVGRAYVRDLWRLLRARRTQAGETAS